MTDSPFVTLPTKAEPRTVEVFVTGPEGEVQDRYTSHSGCSAEWLKENPDWKRDAAEEWQRHPGLMTAPSAYPDGKTFSVRLIVRDLHEGVIVDYAEEVTGTGRPVSNHEAAQIVGVQPSTWRGYVARGQAPSPDYPPESLPEIVAPFSGPWWRERTLREWAAARPGQGARSDLQT